MSTNFSQISTKENARRYLESRRMNVKHSGLIRSEAQLEYSNVGLPKDPACLGVGLFQLRGVPHAHSLCVRKDGILPSEFPSEITKSVLDLVSSK